MNLQETLQMAYETDKQAREYIDSHGIEDASAEMMRQAANGETWEKGGVKRIYFNAYNAYYSFDDNCLFAIDNEKESDFETLENKAIKLIESIF